jgi:hypothetical protein
MTGVIARFEWSLAFRRRRLLALNVGVPLLLVVPLALGTAPPYHAAAVYAVLFVLFGTMGSAIPLLREAESGLLRRIIMTGFPPGRYLAERTASQVGVDFLQLLPAVALIVAAAGGGLVDGLQVAGALVLALVAANLVGVWVAAVARSMAEGALFAAVTTLFLLHGSGVFRTPRPGSWGAFLEGVLPFGPLHRELLRVVVGAPAGGMPDGVGWGAWASWLPAVPGAVLLAGASFLLARALVGRVAGVRS